MNFAVFLMGENFLLEGHESLQGFFITKGIEAPNAEGAAQLAVAAVKADPRFAESLAASTALPPTIQVKVIQSLPHLMRDTEYVFFPMEETDEGLPGPAA